jgi:hypothetical protein
MNKASASQLRKIYALAREKDIDTDNLHSLLYSVCKKEHLSEISVTEAVRLIDSLSGKQNPYRATAKQIHFVKGLAKEFGWNDKRLAGFVKKVGGVDDIKWLTKKKASAVIEGMKKLKEKGVDVYG